MLYDKIPASPNFSKIEEEILEYWKENDTFQKSVDQRNAGEKGSNEFVFFDGPPFANGLPHYGHLLTGYAKDVIPRFQTMRGHRVERRFGWDCHGLPAELEAERELGITDKSQVEEMGIDKYNAACKKSVLKYTDEWKEYVTRQARWVDFDGGYKTLDKDYMESVIWAFKTLYDKGLIYKGYKVLPYCPVDQTPLSNHELRMDDDVYKMRQDETVTVGVRLYGTNPAQTGTNPAGTDAAGTNPAAQIPASAGMTDAINTAEIDPALDGALALVWTTTPWTLPSNFLVAVGPEVEYSVVEVSKDLEGSPVAGERVILATTRLDSYKKEIGANSSEKSSGVGKEEAENGYKVIKTFKGSELDGVKYFPMFRYFSEPNTPNYLATADQAWQIRVGDFVSDSDGTGLVHQAPFGEDDMELLQKNSVIPAVPIDAAACFTSAVTDYEGTFVFDANKQIITDLRDHTGPFARVATESERPVLVRRQSIEHSYPHCWRCRNPLIYNPVSSFFVKVTALKDKMLEMNQSINWIPQNVQDGQFGKWLANARDWAISRNRYWGAPIPIWESDNPDYPRTDVYGSIEELEADFGDATPALAALPKGSKITDLHRPFIDELTRPNPDDPTGKSTMRRVPEVLDCWFESGSMPFAQVHYPFENKEWFADHYPCDFIVEYIGQTRGWFYLMHVMAAGLFGVNAFENVICHGIVLGSDGQKMSKSLRNYPDVNEVFESDGSDAMRWFLMSSPILRGGNLVVTHEAIREATRNVLLPYWSSYYFFTLYANAVKKPDFKPRLINILDVTNLETLDSYILAVTHNLVADMTDCLEDFKISESCALIQEYLDTLTNWYIRNTRSRFWDEDETAFNVLYTCLELVSRVMAPLAPMITEKVWRGLVSISDTANLPESVHLAEWPHIASVSSKLESTSRHTESHNVLSQLKNDDLIATMSKVRHIVTAGLSVRKLHNIRVRQPLASITVYASKHSSLSKYSTLIEKELNIKEVQFVGLNEIDESEVAVSKVLVVNARALGPRVGKNVQTIIKAAKAGSWTLTKSGHPVVTTDTGEDYTLTEAEYTMSQVEDSSKLAEGHFGAMVSGDDFIVVDTNLTTELENEGIARDLIREIQETRKTTGLEIDDRIDLALSLPLSLYTAAEAFKDMISAEALATSWTLSLVEKAEDQKITVKKA